MESLSSFIFYAVLFYIVMRYGCGAHIFNGHNKSHKKESASLHNDIDPVCFKSLDDSQGYGKMHKGHLYRFCSRNCLDKFEVSPEKFIK